MKCIKLNLDYASIHPLCLLESSKCSSQLNQVYPPAQPFAQVSTTVQFHSDAFLHQIKIDFKSGNYLISYE